MPAGWITQIALPDYDRPAFVQLALADSNARLELVRQMVAHPRIMVYYHCYEVLREASILQPELFYLYWDEIAPLLHHPNSYHRDFAVEILANLTPVDREDRFARIADEYFAILSDEKFMTANLCLQNLGKIYQSKPALRKRILEALLGLEQLSPYSPKQTALLQADVLEILDQVYTQAPDPDRIRAYIQAQRASLSPKTRRKAKELARKYR